MLCDKILGTLKDEKFSSLRVDYVDIEWHESFLKIHRKTSAEGDDVGIRMDNSILTVGMKQDDVIYSDDEKVIAVNIPPCDAIKAVVRKDHSHQIAKLCYEVGNTHTSMFRGEDDFTFYIPYHESLMNKLEKIHGVSVEKVNTKLDLSNALSSTVNNHHH